MTRYYSHLFPGGKSTRTLWATHSANCAVPQASRLITLRPLVGKVCRATEGRIPARLLAGAPLQKPGRPSRPQRNGIQRRKMPHEIG